MPLWPRLVDRADVATLRSKFAQGQESSAATTAVVPWEFVIDGMSCQGCADGITSALSRLPGVVSAKVSFQDKRAVILGRESELSPGTVLSAIAAIGYKGQLAPARQSQPALSATPGKAPVLVSITQSKNDLHAVSMALGLAQSAIKDGRNVLVFLSVDAVALAAKNLSADLKCADFPPVKKLLADLIATGGRLLICEHCAHVAGLTQQDTIDGATIIAHGELFANLKPGAVVLSY
jgi:predicted peroxiredoxin/copper chaperone CopZ